MLTRKDRAAWILGMVLSGAAVAWAATVTLPFTFTSGTTAKASEVNANFAALKSAIDSFDARLSTLETSVEALDTRLKAVESSSYSSVSVVQAATLSALHNDFSVVPFDTMRTDRLNEFNLTNHRFTAARAGEYLVCASLYSGGGYDFELDVYKNGSRLNGIAAGSAIANGCIVLRLNAQEYIDIRMYQVSGSSKTVTGNGLWNWMTVQRVS